MEKALSDSAAALGIALRLTPDAALPPAHRRRQAMAEGHADMELVRELRERRTLTASGQRRAHLEFLHTRQDGGSGPEDADVRRPEATAAASEGGEAGGATRRREE